MDRIVFYPRDCQLFSEGRSHLKRYNRERKVVADKFKEIGRQLQPKLRSEGYNFSYVRVSKHYPNPRNHYSVDGIWLAFTGAKHYYRWAQLNIGLYDDGLRIGIEVPRQSTDNPAARRLLMNSATFVAAAIDKVERRGGVYFWPKT
jgi:uncharacterized protein YktB (UPF0637 family)